MEMEKIAQMVEIIVDDVNNEESTILLSFEKILHGLFKIILFAGIPFLIYIFMSMDKLS
jgi:hypothetical protein